MVLGLPVLWVWDGASSAAAVRSSPAARRLEAACNASHELLLQKCFHSQGLKRAGAVFRPVRGARGRPRHAPWLCPAPRVGGLL